MKILSRTLMAALLLMGWFLLGMTQAAPAMDCWWIGDLGDWDVPRNWSPSGPPTSADNAFVDNGAPHIPPLVSAEALNLYIGFDASGGVDNFGSLTIGRTLIIGEGLNSGGYLINRSAATVGCDATIGKRGLGYLENHEFFEVNGHLVVGEDYGGHVRDYGVTRVGGNMQLASHPGSAGSYEAAGARIQAGVVQVGLGGFGELYIDSGGSLKVTDYEFQAGYFAGSEGRVYQGSGQVDVPNAPLVLGVEGGSKGYYDLYDTGYGGSSLSTQDTVIGRGGEGHMKQSGDGSSHQVAGSLILGEEAGSLGTYDMQGGSLQAKNMVVGQRGTGYFSQTGGDVWVQEQMVVGRENYGSYYIGVRGNLSVGDLMQPGELVVGENHNSGFMHEENGQVSVMGQLILGRNAGVSGVYYMTGGKLEVGDTFSQALAGRLVVGESGLGSFDHGSGASVNIFGTLVLGQNPGSSGTYGLGGSLMTTDTVVGQEGEGRFTHWGTHRVSNQLILGAGTQGVGTYDLWSGNLETWQTIVGLGSGGNTFIQRNWDSSHNINFILTIGQEAGASGTYEMSAGQLRTPAIDLGLRGRGQFNLNDGNVYVTEHVTVGVGDPDRNLPGHGTFIQTGGAMSVGNALELARHPDTGATGTYELKGGELSVGSLLVSRNGRFSQTNGSFVVHRNTVNQGVVQLAGDSSAEFHGSVTNQEGGRFAVSNNAGFASLDNQTGAEFRVSQAPTAVEFSGPVTNAGYFKVTNSAVVFHDSFTNSGIYESDPAKNVFYGNLIVTPEGYLLGGWDDVFYLGADFFNTSTRNDLWNTRLAKLSFLNDTTHILQIPGLDKGRSSVGYVNNFSWDVLDITSETIYLVDDTTPGGALYLRKIEGLIFDNPDNPTQILNIFSQDGLNLYYDLVKNWELGGRTFLLQGGGYLAPAVVPVPGTVWLLLSGLAGLAAARPWRRS